jgi:hypothetical protein
VRESLKIFWWLFAAAACWAMLHYTQQHQEIQDISSLSLSPPPFQPPNLSSLLFFFFPLRSRYTESDGGANHQPKLPPPPFSFFFFNFFFFFFFFHLLFPSLFALFASSRRAAVATGARRGSNDYGDHLPLIFIRAPGPELNARVRR